MFFYLIISAICVCAGRFGSLSFALVNKRAAEFISIREETLRRAIAILAVIPFTRRSVSLRMEYYGSVLRRHFTLPALFLIITAGVKRATRARQRYETETGNRKSTETKVSRAEFPLVRVRPDGGLPLHFAQLETHLPALFEELI